MALARLRRLGYADSILERTYHWWAANQHLVDPDGTPETFFERFGEWAYMATPANELE